MNTRVRQRLAPFAVLLATVQVANAGLFETLLFPGSETTVASDIEGGAVVGYYDAGGKRNGFIYDRNTGTWTTLNHPNSASYTQFNAIDGARILGQYRNLGEYHGFLYDAGNWRTLDFPGSNYTLPWKIDGDLVVGFYEGAGGFGNEHGFIHNLLTGEWKSFDVPGASRTWGGGIDGSVVAGHYGGSAQAGFQYDLTLKTWTFLDVPGSTSTFILGMDQGKTLGMYNMPGEPDPGFLFDGSQWRSIEYPGSPETVVLGVEGDWIVGYAKLGPYNERGFIANYNDFPILPNSNSVPDTGSTALLSLFALLGMHLSTRIIRNFQAPARVERTQGG